MIQKELIGWGVNDKVRVEMIRKEHDMGSTEH